MNDETAKNMKVGQKVTFKERSWRKGSYELTHDPIDGVDGIYFKINDSETERCKGLRYHSCMFEEPHE
jgi:hypothetical protein